MTPSPLAIALVFVMVLAILLAATAIDAVLEVRRARLAALGKPMRIRKRMSEHLIAAYRTELAVLEEELRKASLERHKANVQHEIAAIQYAALRDALAEHGKVYEDGGEHQYRFIRMQVGDAVRAALSEIGPSSLREIAAWLERGGWSKNGTGRRNVNAALINAKGITKLPNGRYDLAVQQ